MSENKYGFGYADEGRNGSSSFKNLSYNSGINMSVGEAWVGDEDSADALFGNRENTPSVEKSCSDRNENGYTGVERDESVTEYDDNSDLVVDIAAEEREFVFIGHKPSGGEGRRNSHIPRVSLSPTDNDELSDDDVLSLSGAEVLGFGDYNSGNDGLIDNANASFGEVPRTGGRRKEGRRLDLAYADLLSGEDTEAQYPDPEYTDDNAYGTADYVGPEYYGKADRSATEAYSTAGYTAGGGAIYPDPEAYDRYPDPPPSDHGVYNNNEIVEAPPVSDYEESFTGVKRDRRQRERELLSFGTPAPDYRYAERMGTVTEYDDPDDAEMTPSGMTREEELSHYAALNRTARASQDGGERVYDKASVGARIKAERTRDIELVVARNAFECAEMSREYERGSMRFSKMTFAEERELAFLRRELGNARRRQRHAKAAERHDNDRYYYSLQHAPEDIKLSPKGDRERLGKLTAQVSELLSERDEINRQLIMLYKGGTGRGRLKSVRKMAEAERRASLREYKKLRSVARELRGKGTSGLKREQVYTLMDERVELVGRLAVLDYKIWHEKMSREAKRELRRQRKEMLRDLQDNATLLNRHAERALIDVRRHSRANFSTVLGILGLALIVAAILLVWIYREPIVEFLRQVLDGTLSKLSEKAPEIPPADGDTALGRLLDLL